MVRTRDGCSSRSPLFFNQTSYLLVRTAWLPPFPPPRRRRRRRCRQSRDEDKMHWTPILALGKVSIYVCDPVAACRDPTLPVRLNERTELA